MPAVWGTSAVAGLARMVRDILHLPGKARHVLAQEAAGVAGNPGMKAEEEAKA